MMRLQLAEFYYSMKTYGLKSDAQCPENWVEAFHLLQELLDSKSDGSNQVIFIDELPWMDTPRSGFVSAFEHFCNDWCSARRHVKLIVCGSATSWICDEMLEGKGGLYNRVTSSIHVGPFTLRECEEFFREEGFRMDKYDIVQAYMAFGGIPYYLSQFREDLSVVQNIDKLLFDQDSILYDEFDKLFFFTVRKSRLPEINSGIHRKPKMRTHKGRDNHKNRKTVWRNFFQINKGIGKEPFD